jgi:dihydroorotase
MCAPPRRAGGGRGCGQQRRAKMPFDLIIANGHVLDPANGIDEVIDVGISDGVIAAIGHDLVGTSESAEVFDAAGMLVTPGLVDSHVHCMAGLAPYGMSPDEHCLGRGCTTVVDAGTAGANSLAGLKEHVAAHCQTRVLSFCHAAMHGLVGSDAYGYGPTSAFELCNIDMVNVPKAVHAIQEDQRSGAASFCVGVKVRLTKRVSNGGVNEREGLARALQIAEESGVRVMVHHSDSSVPVSEVLGALRAGDIYTHCFHGATDDPETGSSLGTALVDVESEGLVSAALDARARGIQFCLGHGQGSFVWNVAEAAASAGFFCDSLSTDLHIASINGPAYDMPTMLTKGLMLGMTLSEVVAASTIQPAQLIGWEDRIGTLGVGRGADVTVRADQPPPRLWRDRCLISN